MMNLFRKQALPVYQPIPGSREGCPKISSLFSTTVIHHQHLCGLLENDGDRQWNNNYLFFYVALQFFIRSKGLNLKLAARS